MADTEIGSFVTQDALTTKTTFGGEDSHWDSFVLNTPHGHHEQTSLWARVKEVYGWKSIRIVARYGDEIQGGVQALLRPIGKWGSVAYVSRGPVIKTGREILCESLLRELGSILSKHRVVYLALTLPYSGHVYEPVLLKLNYSLLPPVIPPSGIMTATSILDLTPDTDVLLQRMRKTTRYNIKYGFRTGVTVREGTGKEIATFQKLMYVLCQRRGVSPSPSQKDFFDNLWGIFSPQGLMKLFLAEYQGSVVSAMLTFAYGNSFKTWKFGWSGEHAQCHPNEVLHWEMIQWAKANGFQYFDFVSVNPVIARQLIPKENTKCWLNDGSSYFKLGFGGEVILLPEPYWYGVHPLLNGFIRLGGASMLRHNSFMGRIVRRFARSVGD
jgi:peptidoglycan pentaglycine glycine transferase (the first glycine)